MKNKKMKKNLKADPNVQLLFAKTSIQFLSKNITEFSKTQNESKRKGIESDVECLWYALEILNSYESLFSNPDERTRKSLLDVNLDELLDPPTGYLVTRAVLGYIAEIVVEASGKYPDRQESLEGYLNVLWTTLEIMNTCKFFFQDLNKSSEKLAA
jgi:hypothetical protein